MKVSATQAPRIELEARLYLVSDKPWWDAIRDISRRIPRTESSRHTLGRATSWWHGMTVEAYATLGFQKGSVCWGVPLYGTMPAAATKHLLDVLTRGIASQTFGSYCMVEGAYIDHARNTIVHLALQCAAEDDNITHLFFQDQDVVVPEGTIEALMAHQKPVVGAVYFGRDRGNLPIAFDIEPFRRIEDIDLEGLNKVGGVGMGATLIELDVFRGMARHFNDAWFFSCRENAASVEDGTRRTGEDIWFAQRCSEMGIDIYLDGAASCGHIGTVEITAEHYKEARRWRQDQSSVVS
jgi:hypothetical protein